MGQEIKCKAIVNGRKAEGRLQLEMDTLYFRSPTEKFDVATKDVKVKVSDGILTVTTSKAEYALELGDVAERWAFRIQHPKSLLDKLGVGVGANILVVGHLDKDLIDELNKANAKLSTRKNGGNRDWIFVGVDQPSDLKLLEGLSRFIKPKGGVWVIFPKGRPDLKAEHAIAVGKANGLVDTKIARVSELLTGMKFVIPVKLRN
jgi:hypothetical protein